MWTPIGPDLSQQESIRSIAVDPLDSLQIWAGDDTSIVFFSSNGGVSWTNKLVDAVNNHLIVDAVAAVFPFGSQEFVQLREHFWIETLSTAAKAGQSLIFTFAPEPTVTDDFPERVSRLIEAADGEVVFVALDVEADEQERRLVEHRVLR